MQWEQWQTAKQQLLSHLHRSGVTRIPVPNAESVAKASQWLDQNGVRAQSIAASAATAATSLSTAVGQTSNASLLGATASPDSNAASVASMATIAKPQSSSQNSVGTSSGSIGPQPSSSIVSRPSSARPPAQVNSVLGDWLTKSVPAGDRDQIFESMRSQVAACRKCTDIFCYRQRTVFGVGPSNAKLVMFGEAPGADEDRAGEPFVGAAGQLLNKILEASGLKRENVYIMNALKCRPPNNRTPTEIEIENCRPFFDAQLEAIQPEYIVCWGSVAVRAVLRTTESVGRLRGKFHAFRGAKVLVTYHPAYLLRNPDAKRLTWEDMKLLMKELGIPVPPPRKQ